MKGVVVSLLVLTCGMMYAHQAHEQASTHDHAHDHGPADISFISDRSRLPDAAVQAAFAAEDRWQQFARRHTSWQVEFDETSAMPRRAFGRPIAVAADTDPFASAITFLNAELEDFTADIDHLVPINAHSTAKYTYVDFQQRHAGLDVLNSRVRLRFTPDWRVAMFGLELFPAIELNTVPTLTVDDAITVGLSELKDWERQYVRAAPELKIQPVPAGDSYRYHLVYEMEVRAEDDGEGPVWLYTLVDAHTGQIIYRQNQMCSVDTYTLTGTVSLSNPHDGPFEPIPLAGVKVSARGRDYFTDANGRLNYPGATPTNARIFLENGNAKVVSGNQGNNAESPNFNVTLEPGDNTISLDGAFNRRQLSAFYHTNLIYSYMKSKLPDFEGLDKPLVVRVDRPNGACNAFYDGSSINFFNENSNCFSFAEVRDVVYHEYGHAISWEFYTSFGQPFRNGALGEAYSDVWGMLLTGEGILGKGARKSSPNSFIRRYDNRRRVYPQDIRNEVHRDGEILAGAWWDLAQILGSLEQMGDLFAETLHGLANGPSGTEGAVYSDVLVDALLADDDDGDLSNGGPNAAAILEAFALHGITIRNVQLSHTEQESAAAEKAIAVEVTADFPEIVLNDRVRGDIFLMYRTRPTEEWKRAPSERMGASTTEDGSVRYRALVPAMPAGTVLSYFFEAQDEIGNRLRALPSGVDPAEGPELANPPFVRLIGLEQQVSENFETGDFSDWKIGAPDDNATAGIWEIDAPNGTFFNFQPVQPGADNTPDERAERNFCAFTGNTGQPNELPGANDVDAGKTTLFSPIFDLSDYRAPAIEYYRWYSNDASINPNNDFWEVHISNDGASWIPVERTRNSDASWRRIAFSVSDYVEPNATVQLRFVAADNLVSGAQSNGGSLVEAAIDDLAIYDIEDDPDTHPTSVADQDTPDRNGLNVYPNPVVDNLTIEVEYLPSAPLQVVLYSALGTVIARAELNSERRLTIPTQGIANGVYLLSIAGENLNLNEPITIAR